MNQTTHDTISSGTFRHRLAYGINLLFSSLEAFFIALSLTEFAKYWVAEPRYGFLGESSIERDCELILFLCPAPAPILWPGVLAASMRPPPTTPTAA